MAESTRSFLFPDVNVWMALTCDRHVHHETAKAWFMSLGPNARLFFCRITQLGLLRLLTTEAVMGKEDVLNQVGAWKAYDQWFQDDRVSFLDESPGVEPDFRARASSRQASPKDWADSYLAAFAASSNLTIVSFDRGFRNKSGRGLILEAKV